MYVQSTKEQYIKDVIEDVSDMVYRLALTRVKQRELAEDVYQEVFYRFTKKMPEFESLEHRKAWFIRVTINCSKNILTSSWLNRVDLLDEDIPFETKERHDVYYAVQSLNKNYRTVIYLYYYEGYKVTEIAKLMRKNESTIKTWLRRARGELKLKLKGGFEDE